MTVPRGFTLFLAASAGLLPGCSASSDESPTADRKAVEATVNRYVEATNKGDAQALAQLYEDDAVLLPPDHQPVEGRAAIGEFWRQGTDEGLEVTTLRLDVEGGLGYLVGQYTLPETDEEPADSGKTVMCLRRQPDGSWKVTADIWNSSVGDEDDDEDDTNPAPSIS
ncbi:MAG TPA: SgcJ/EcaC family oxidoreductase [Gemmatimonadales bacterium]|nr:SgcJ/EcaC family oxidoreductase [Gemmatimonadales bacterium]